MLHVFKIPLYYELIQSHIHSSDNNHKRHIHNGRTSAMNLKDIDTNFVVPAINISKVLIKLFWMVGRPWNWKKNSHTKTHTYLREEVI